MHRSLSLFALLFLMAMTCPQTAWAQRTADNAVTQAEDGFGASIGGEDLGLYSQSEVRGFSPTAAGNIRLEGLYVDRQGDFTGRLVSGNRIRVGPSVLGYPFPAPSGVVDFRLRAPGADRVLSAVVNVDDFGDEFVEIDIELPELAPGLGLAGGVGIYQRDYAWAGTARVRAAAVIGRWRPAEGVEIMPFISGINTTDQQEQQVYLVDGVPPPNDAARRVFIGQPWALTQRRRRAHGLLASATRGAWRLQGGLFYSSDLAARDASILFENVQPDGAANRVITMDQNRRAKSVSGEVRLTRRVSQGRLDHAVHLSFRGRSQRRVYGGGDVADLGPGFIDRPAFEPEPTFVFGPQTRDAVDQTTLGLAYDVALRGRGELNVSLAHSDYSKAVDAPGVALPESRDKPWLYSVGGAWRVGSSLTLYGGASRGLEESEVAPKVAVNRNEAPPAILTEQIDFGLRWAPRPQISAVLGVFQIDKPYYGLDDNRVFKALGDVRHRGLEASVTARPMAGLSIVGGALFLDATLDSGGAAGVGARPVGAIDQTLFANIDYQPPALPGFSIDAGLTAYGERIGDVRNLVVIERSAFVDVGLRYRFQIDGTPAVLRLQATNVFDAFAWDVVGSGAFQYVAPRKLTARLTVDF